MAEKSFKNYRGIIDVIFCHYGNIFLFMTINPQYQHIYDDKPPSLIFLSVIYPTVHRKKPKLQIQVIDQNDKRRKYSLNMLRQK